MGCEEIDLKEIPTLEYRESSDIDSLDILSPNGTEDTIIED